VNLNYLHCLPVARCQSSSDSAGLSITTSGQPDFSASVPIDFRVGSELYSRYRLEDGSILLAKLVVTKFFSIADADPETQAKYYSSSSFILTSICPPELRGKPTIPLPDLTRLNPEESVPVGIKPEQEPWNYYELGDGVSIFSRILVTGVRRTKLISGDGDPIYLIDSQTNGFRLDANMTFYPMKSMSSPLPSQRSQSIPEH
jgi:hypothetical protein